MTKQEVNNLVASIGLPYAYYQFDEQHPQKPPFVCFFYTGSSDLYADQSNYQKITGLSIELYSAEKDFPLEEKIETLLNNNGLTYYKEENYIRSERIWQTAYDMEIIITRGE